MTIINVKDAPYNAVGDGINDDTSAIQTAANTGYQLYMPEGTYLVKDKITLKSGQMLRGDGRTNSYFIINSSFNMNATSVLQLGTGEPGAQIFDIGFRFSQPNTVTNRSQCIQYPYAIDVSTIQPVTNPPAANARAVIDRIRIESGWSGINATGNCGGVYIGFVEIGTLNMGVDIDGAQDFFHGTHWHFWPFGMSAVAGLMSVYLDGGATSVSIGRCDGLTLDSLSTFGQAVQITANNNLSSMPLQISQIQLDSDQARLVMVGGAARIGILYSTKTNVSTSPSVSITGGTCTIGMFSCASGSSSYELYTNNTGALYVLGGEIVYTNLSNSAARTDGGYMSLSNIKFVMGPTDVLHQPKALQNGGSLAMNNCNFDAATTGTGYAVFYVSDSGSNHCSNNEFGGWGYAPPGGLLGKYNGNTNCSTGALVASAVIGNIITNTFYIVLDGSGNYVGAHGIANLNERVLYAEALVKGGSGQAIPTVIQSIDAVNFTITAGSAYANIRARVTIVYTPTIDIW